MRRDPALLAIALVALLAGSGCISVELAPAVGDADTGDATSDQGQASRQPAARPGSSSASATAKPSPAPAPKDTDKDGASDQAEVENGTDPKDASDKPYVLPAAPTVDAGPLLVELASFVTQFSDRKLNTDDHVASRDWLSEAFADAGLEVWRQPFEAGGLAQENIAGIRWGLDRTAWVVVGAHYDTTTTASVDRSASQGAYDDGSGTMMVVHIAKAFANLTLPYTLVFVAFDGEERGLEGSKAFVAGVLTDDTPFAPATIVGAVNLDMFGLNWPGTGAPMVFVTNSVPLQAAAEAARLAQGVPDEGITYGSGMVLGSSDYATFFDEGVPTGFFLSDFEALGAPMGLAVATPPPAGVYPFWHLSDTMQTMTLMAGDAAHLEMGFQAGVDLATAVVHHLASTPGPLSAGTDAV
jgi:hypothetical protein